MNRPITMATLAVLLLTGSLGTAIDVDDLCAAFHPVHVNGPHAGKRLCLV